MGKITRIGVAFKRVVEISGEPFVVTISKSGLAFRPLSRRGKRIQAEVPVSWKEIFRDGGTLDASECQAKPLLKFAR